MPAASLRTTLSHMLAVAGLAAFAVVAWWLSAAPSWPTFRAVTAASFLLAVAVYAAVFLLVARGPDIRLRRAGLGSLAAGGVGGLVYALLWVLFTHPALDGSRIVGGGPYSAIARDHVEHADRPLSLEEVLWDMENDPDLVFDRSSLVMVRAAVLGTWLVTVAGLGGLTAVLLAHSVRQAVPADPVIARLQSRIAGWPADFDPRLRAELLQALRTLTEAGNAPGAILTVSGLLEGEGGLLGRVAGACDRQLKRDNLFAQIEGLAQAGALPAEVVSDLHWVRLRANKARHNKSSVGVDDATTAIGRAVHVVEWYHFHFAHGPRLPASAGPSI